MPHMDVAQAENSQFPEDHVIRITDGASPWHLVASFQKMSYAIKDVGVDRSVGHHISSKTYRKTSFFTLRAGRSSSANFLADTSCIRPITEHKLFSRERQRKNASEVGRYSLRVGISPEHPLEPHLIESRA